MYTNANNDCDLIDVPELNSGTVRYGTAVVFSPKIWVMENKGKKHWLHYLI